jgi:rhodanese-related sulfurtransferase
MKKMYLIGGLALALLLALGGAASAGLFGNPALDNEKLVVNFCNEVRAGGYGVVDTDTLKGWMDAKKSLVVVDTMPYEASYQKNHIPGAVQFLFPVKPQKEMDPGQQAKYAKLLGPDKNAVIVVYCGFPKCGRSHNGAMWAKKLGYQNVYRYPGGIKAWLEKDYPAASK